jgi:serine/threonine-protein phosphatase 2A regulatory subunit A
MSSPPSQLYPIHLLMDELKSEEVVLRLSSIRRLSTIALALGPLRTREELVPFLQDQLDDEDEVLLVLAEELGNFAEYVGGKEHAWTVLGPLENLAAVEETMVRDKVGVVSPCLIAMTDNPQAAESISKISVLLSATAINEHFLPVIRRLALGDWFTSRTSACALFAAPYPTATPEAQNELRNLYGALSGDDTPMVRRAAAKALGVSPHVCSGPRVEVDLYSHSPNPSRPFRISTRSSSLMSSPCTGNSQPTTRIRYDSSLFPT